MKKFILVSVICAFSAMVALPLADAQQVPGPSGGATAQVPSFLEFAFSEVYKMIVAENDSDPFRDGTKLAAPDFTFGNLSAVRDPVDNSILYMQGEFWYAVMMIASTSGRRYKITETGSLLSGPGGSLPKESVLLIPDYQWQDQLVAGTDQGAPPGAAFVGPVTTASDTGSLVYQSDNNGLGRMVRAYVTIGGPPVGEKFPVNYSLGYNGTAAQGAKQQYTSWKPITPDQKAGSYTGTITFSLVLN